MKRASLICAGLLLMNCGGSGSSGGLRIDPLPPAVADPCPHPASLTRIGDAWLVNAGRLGSALLECGREKAVAVEAYDGIRAVLE